MRYDYTHKDYEGLRALLLALARERLPEWTDHSPNDLGVTMVELFAALGDTLLYYQDRIANESYLGTAIERRSVQHLLALIGYTLRPPTPASADLTLFFMPDAPATTVPHGTRFQTPADLTGTALLFQYVRADLSVNVPALPLATGPDGKPYRRYATLPVVHIDADVRDEVVGSSSGERAQRFRLAQAGVVAASLGVRVDEGVGARLWQQVPSLLVSQPDDAHYTLVHEADGGAFVVFGDGSNGRPPRRGIDNIRASYRTGGGARGNVGAHTISKIQDPVPGLKLVTNERPATNGADAEPLADAVRRGPAQFRAGGRAVTAQDYEAFALEFGVGKARARSVGWNHVELFVAPAGGGLPTDTLKDELLAHLDTRRMLTTTVAIRDPRYVPVVIEGSLRVEAYHFTEDVRAQVQAAIRRVLAFDQVDFEMLLYISKVYEAAESVPGVQGFNVTRFARQGRTTGGALPSLDRTISGVLPGGVLPGGSLRPSIGPLAGGGALPSDGVLRFAWDEIPVAFYADGVFLPPEGVEGGRRVG